MYVRMGRPKKAVAAFLRLARGRGAGLQVGARALYRAASILDDLGEARRAESLLFETIDSYPEMLAADDALRRLVDLYRRQGRVGALLPLLKRRFLRLVRNDIADNLLFEAAEILRQDLGQRDAAAALYLELARTYPKSPLLDDSLWLAGQIRRQQKRYRDAILIFKRLLATREDAFGGASYLSEWLDDAQLAIAKIWLLGLRRPKRAQAELRELISSFDSSVLRDDAQHWIVLCEVERGRLRQAKMALAKLRRDYPDSRYARAGSGKALDLWFAFRQAARGSRTREACALLARLGALRPRPWLAAHAPRILPWPRCPFVAAPPPSDGGRR